MGVVMGMKGMLLTDRDRQIVDFLNAGFVGTSKIIEKLFFTDATACRRRLCRLAEHEVVNRTREIEYLPYLYFTKPSSKNNLDYKLKVAEFYAELHSLNLEIVEVQIDHKLFNVTFDLRLVMCYKSNNYVIYINCTKRDVYANQFKDYCEHHKYHHEDQLKKSNAVNYFQVAYADRCLNKHSKCLFINKNSDDLSSILTVLEHFHKSRENKKILNWDLI